mgnify:CR=1 FL=1
MGFGDDETASSVMERVPSKSLASVVNKELEMIKLNVKLFLEANPSDTVDLTGLFRATYDSLRKDFSEKNYLVGGVLRMDTKYGNFSESYTLRIRRNQHA